MKMMIILLNINHIQKSNSTSRIGIKKEEAIHYRKTIKSKNKEIAHICPHLERKWNISLSYPNDTLKCSTQENMLLKLQ